MYNDAYKEAVKVIKDCQTFEQLHTASRQVQLFRKRFSDIDLYDELVILWTKQLRELGVRYRETQAKKSNQNNETR